MKQTLFQIYCPERELFAEGVFKWSKVGRVYATAAAARRALGQMNKWNQWRWPPIDLSKLLIIESTAKEVTRHEHRYLNHSVDET